MMFSGANDLWTYCRTGIGHSLFFPFVEAEGVPGADGEGAMGARLVSDDKGLAKVRRAGTDVKAPFVAVKGL